MKSSNLEGRSSLLRNFQDMVEAGDDRLSKTNLDESSTKKQQPGSGVDTEIVTEESRASKHKDGQGQFNVI